MRWFSGFLEGSVPGKVLLEDLLLDWIFLQKNIANLNHKKVYRLEFQKQRYQQQIIIRQHITPKEISIMPQRLILQVIQISTAS